MIIQEIKTIKVQNWKNIIRFMLDFFVVLNVDTNFYFAFHLLAIYKVPAHMIHSIYYNICQIVFIIYGLLMTLSFFFSSTSILSFLVLWFIAAVSKSKSCYMFRASNGCFFFIFFCELIADLKETSDLKSHLPEDNFKEELECFPHKFLIYGRQKLRTQVNFDVNHRFLKQCES